MTREALGFALRAKATEVSEHRGANGQVTLTGCAEEQIVKSAAEKKVSSLSGCLFIQLFYLLPHD